MHTTRVSERPPRDSPQHCYVNAEGWRWCDYSLARLTAAGFGWNYSATTRKRRLNAWWPYLTLCVPPPLRSPPPTYIPALFTFSWPGLVGPPFTKASCKASDLEPDRSSSALHRGAKTPPQIPSRLSSGPSPPPQDLPSISKHLNSPNRCLASQHLRDPSPIQRWIYKRLTRQSSSGKR